MKGLMIEKALCTGCRACESVCPLNCITMVTDNEGFLYPEIDEGKCVRCGKCREVCIGYKPRSDSACSQKRTFAAWNRNPKIRNGSSSGGMFYLLAEHIITGGGVVYGAAFDDSFAVRHRRIEKIEDLPALMGSKYVQSDIGQTYRQALEDLKTGRNVLYSGTPCQISAFLGFTKGYEEKLITVSVVCHGVPSPEIWKRYLALKKGQYGENRVKKISFRDKTYGWKDFGIYIEFDHNCYLCSHKEDLYMQGFLQNLFLRPSCYQCRAKGLWAGADIILGDFWGIGEEIPEIDTDLGVNCGIVCTSKGLDIWNKIQDSVCSQDIAYETVCRHNSALEHSVPPNGNRTRFFEDLSYTGLIEEAMRAYVKPVKISDNERYLYQYDIVAKYLEKKMQKFSVAEMFCRLGMKRVVLYAVTDLLNLVLTDILNDKRDVSVFISDRQFQWMNGWYRGMAVIAPCELKRLIEQNVLDGIIVCNPIRENEIIDGFLGEGIELKKIYSLVSLIYD